MSPLPRRAALALPGLLLAGPAAALSLPPRITQGMLVVGRADPGARLRLGERAVRVSPEGAFAFGTAREAPPELALHHAPPGGRAETRTLAVEPRAWPVQRIEGLPGRMVEPSPADLARIRAEQERLNAARRAEGTVAHFAGGLDWPVRGRISGVFGSQRILNGQPRAPHSGLDIAAPSGTPVIAAAPGRVTLTGDLYFAGITAVVEHGHGVATLYAHLSALSVGEGEAVSRGQVLGAVGATGRATGPHLHLGLYWFSTAVDPHPALG